MTHDGKNCCCEGSAQSRRNNKTPARRLIIGVMRTLVVQGLLFAVKLYLGD